jgi:hypothetical protein
MVQRGLAVEGGRGDWLGRLVHRVERRLGAPGGLTPRRERGCLVPWCWSSTSLSTS